jgi:hypothetical protein
MRAIVARGKKEQSDRLRAALRRFMEFKDYSVAEWARNAGIAEGTLRNFLAGTSETLTHATLAALARAASQPIAAIIGEAPLEGYSEPIPVHYEVNATTISTERRMPAEKCFDIYLPTDLRYPNARRFGAVVRDDSAQEFYRAGSIVIWVNYVDIDRVPTDGDRVLLIERRHVRNTKPLIDDDGYLGVDDTVNHYRITIREFSINSAGEKWFSFPTSYKTFKPGTLPMLAITGDFNKDEDGYYFYEPDGIATFVVTIEGLIIASYSLEEYRT